jgi:hypothetical protein
MNFADAANNAYAGWQVWEIFVEIQLRQQRLFSRTIRFAAPRQQVARNHVLFIQRTVVVELSGLEAPRGFQRHRWILPADFEAFVGLVPGPDYNRGIERYLPLDY